VEGPHGRFTLTDDVWDGHDVLFVAGGTGIAPVRSMLLDTLRHGNAPRCALVYSARDDREFAFLPELRRIQRERQIALSLIATRSAPSRWKGLSGRLTASVLRSLVVNADPVAFVCGPEGFVRDVKAALEDMRVRKIRTEEQ
jgi:Na+-transporting NADH:ubiquinone oxidoreductase subunit F/CDP-4-dehydro-6-deoxyglucose reductase